MNNSGLIFIVIFFSLTILLALSKPKYIPSQSLFLLRALLPSWRFFENITDVPLLFYRTKDLTGSFSNWKPCFKNPKRSCLGLFINTETNLHFAYGSLLQHLIHDLESLHHEDAIDISEIPTYKLVRNLARFKLLEQENTIATNEFQFKLSCASQDNLEQIEDVLISATEKI